MNETKDTLYFSEILNDALPELPADSPTVLFFDGVGVTRDRENYNLTDPRYGDAMLDASRVLCGEIPHTCFQISDELSIIFPNIGSFASRINAHYLTHDEICGLSAQAFSEEFSNIYEKKTRFHVRIHTLRPEDCNRYIAWRRKYTKKAVYIYFLISKGAWKSEYRLYEEKELLSIIMRNGLYGKFIKNRRYVEGVVQNIPRDTPHSSYQLLTTNAISIRHECF